MTSLLYMYYVLVAHGCQCYYILGIIFYLKPVICEK